MIYLIQDENGFVKIGFSNNVENRIKYLKSITPYKIDVLLIKEGDFNYEQELHRRFSSSKKRGEWFYFTEDLKLFIEQNKENDLRWYYGFDTSQLKHGVKIRYEKIRQGLTYKELGEKLNMTAQSAQELETRELHGTITLNSLRKAARALGKELDYRFIEIE